MRYNANKRRFLGVTASCCVVVLCLSAFQKEYVRLKYSHYQATLLSSWQINLQTSSAFTETALTNTKIVFKQQKPVDHQSTLIYSVYLTKVEHDKNTRISLVAIRSCDNNLPLYVRVTWKSGVASTVLRLNGNVVELYRRCKSSWAPGCRWNAFLYEGYLTNTHPQHVGSMAVSVSDSTKSEKETIKIPPEQIRHRYPVWLNVIRSTIREVIIVQPQPSFNNTEFNYTHPLTVCIQPMYLFADWVQLVQFFEIWCASGATHFYLYVTHISSLVDKIITDYEEEGLVTRRIWQMPPTGKTENPSAASYRLNHLAAMTDCLLYSAGEAKYTAMTDMDEFLISSHPSRTSVVEAIDRLLSQNPEWGSLTLMDVHRLAYMDKPNYPILNAKKIQLENVDFGYLHSVKRQTRSKSPPKYIVRPHTIAMPHTHNVLLHRVGYTDINRPSILHMGVYHLRKRPVHYSAKRLDSFGIIDRLIPIINRNVHALLNNHFPPNTTLDTAIDVTEAVGNCMAKWRQIGHSCKLPMVCLNHIPPATRNETTWILYRQNQAHFHTVV